MGFDALISEKALEQTNRGKLMYAQSVLSTLFTFKPKRYKIITPDGTFDDKAFIVTCANASQYGNDAFIAPNADIQDGKMNIEIVKPLTPIEMTQAAIQMFTKNLPTNSNLVEIITSEAIFERECEGAMHIDGNAIQTQKDIHVRIIKQGLNVIVPRK